MEGARGRGWGPSSWLWGGLGVALVWPWCGFVLRSICLVYAYYMALRWLWVACGTRHGVGNAAQAACKSHEGSTG
jgi:hypothetical protein